MNTVNDNALVFMKLELKKAQIEVSKKKSTCLPDKQGKEAVDFYIKINNGGDLLKEFIAHQFFQIQSQVVLFFIIKQWLKKSLIRNINRTSA